MQMVLSSDPLARMLGSVGDHEMLNTRAVCDFIVTEGIDSSVRMLNILTCPSNAPVASISLNIMIKFVSQCK